jgi:hypothetical protein
VFDSCALLLARHLENLHWYPPYRATVNMRSSAQRLANVAKTRFLETGAPTGLTGCKFHRAISFLDVVLTATSNDTSLAATSTTIYIPSNTTQARSIPNILRLSAIHRSSHETSPVNHRSCQTSRLRGMARPRQEAG